jgi:hypothetical protein
MRPGYPADGSSRAFELLAHLPGAHSAKAGPSNMRHGEGEHAKYVTSRTGNFAIFAPSVSEPNRRCTTRLDAWREQAGGQRLCT